MAVTTKDNLALLVLCSTPGYKGKNETVKPFTLVAYNKLERRLAAAGRTPGCFLTEKLDCLVESLSLEPQETTQIEALLLRAGELGRELERLAQQQIFIVGRSQDNYPSKLKEAMGQQAPVVFFYAGDLRLLEQETVAIIGSRTANAQEIDYAAKHARISAQNGRTVVSGGAKGIDAVAKESALRAGGAVVTYVADTMGNYVDKHREEILWGKMLVLSSFHPDATFRGYNALERNRHIYASSDYAVVVSSGDETGGSYKGAATCLKQNLCPLYVKDDGQAPIGNQKLIALGGLPLNEAHERLGT